MEFNTKLLHTTVASYTSFQGAQSPFIFSFIKYVPTTGISRTQDLKLAEAARVFRVLERLQPEQVDGKKLHRNAAQFL